MLIIRAKLLVSRVYNMYTLFSLYSPQNISQLSLIPCSQVPPWWTTMSMSLNTSDAKNTPPHLGYCFPEWLWSKRACPPSPLPGTDTRSPRWWDAAHSCASCRCRRCQSNRPWCRSAAAPRRTASKLETRHPSGLCRGSGRDLAGQHTSVSTTSFLHRRAAERGGERRVRGIKTLVICRWSLNEGIPCFYLYQVALNWATLLWKNWQRYQLKTPFEIQNHQKIYVHPESANANKWQFYFWHC